MVPVCVEKLLLSGRVLSGRGFDKAPIAEWLLCALLRSTIACIRQAANRLGAGHVPPWWLVSII